MKTIYQSSTYSPERVTGHYVRCTGRKGAYVFRVFEAETGPRGPGMGYTLREYDTSGDELPDDLKQRCIASKTTEKWK